MKQKIRKELILNTDKVIAHTSKGEIFPWEMGKLKQAFMSKKLGYDVIFVYHIKSNTNYYVHYAPTKGFKYIEYQKYLDMTRGRSE